MTLETDTATETAAGTTASLPPIDFDRPLLIVLAKRLDEIDLAQAVRLMRSAACSGRGRFVFTPNLNFAMAARTGDAFRGLVLSRISKLDRWRVPSLDSLAFGSAAARSRTRHLQIKLRRALKKELR